MKQLHFYSFGDYGEIEYIKDWPNWTGETPQYGDIVVLHFGDHHEEAVRCRCFYRIIDGTKPDDIDIVVKMLK